jgi:hypothetical protein
MCSRAEATDVSSSSVSDETDEEEEDDDDDFEVAESEEDEVEDDDDDVEDNQERLFPIFPFDRRTLTTTRSVEMPPTNVPRAIGK